MMKLIAVMLVSLAFAGNAYAAHAKAKSVKTSEAATVGTIAGNGLKACSPFQPGNWRDTFQVPATWTQQDCQAYAVASGATDYQLLCLFPNAFSRGAQRGTSDPSPAPPPSNCGW